MSYRVHTEYHTGYSYSYRVAHMSIMPHMSMPLAKATIAIVIEWHT